MENKHRSIFEEAEADGMNVREHKFTRLLHGHAKGALHPCNLEQARTTITSTKGCEPMPVGDKVGRDVGIGAVVEMP